MYCRTMLYSLFKNSLQCFEDVLGRSCHRFTRLLECLSKMRHRIPVQFHSGKSPFSTNQIMKLCFCVLNHISGYTKNNLFPRFVPYILIIFPQISLNNYKMIILPSQAVEHCPLVVKISLVGRHPVELVVPWRTLGRGMGTRDRETLMWLLLCVCLNNVMLKNAEDVYV